MKSKLAEILYGPEQPGPSAARRSSPSQHEHRGQHLNRDALAPL
jgi:hypothetical protein